MKVPKESGHPQADDRDVPARRLSVQLAIGLGTLAAACRAGVIRAATIRSWVSTSNRA